MPGHETIKTEIRNFAIELGFAACGFAKAVSLDDHRKPLLDFLDAGFHGEMAWLARNTEMRTDPRLLVEGAQTVISLLAPYYTPLKPHPAGNPRISRYALGEDYHKVLRQMGKRLLHFIRERLDGCQGRFFTDSAPVMEREWARRAGLGWIGKNGCLINNKEGSWFFIAEIIIDHELAPDQPASYNHCGNCSRCIDACPTGALIGQQRINASRCISYLTIEHPGDLPKDLRGKWADWIFGCDICQEVCPWNREPMTTNIERLKPRDYLPDSDAAGLLLMTSEQFDERFCNSPLQRAGFDRLSRNLTFLEPIEPAVD